jgi:glycosyltransferase involved in cell wall biosynthesis
MYQTVLHKNSEKKYLYQYFLAIYRKIMLRIESIYGDFYNFVLFNRILYSESKFDIFHFNNGGYPGKIAGLWALVAAKIYGINKTVMTIQNLPSNRIYLWKIPDYYNYIYDWITRSFCDVIITVAGNRLHTKMNQERKYPKDQLKTIYHGLEEHVSLIPEKINDKKNELGIPLSSPVLIITANLEEPRKGHAILFQALTHVVTQFTDLKLLVVGEGTKKSELLKLQSLLSLEKNIIFLGHRTDIGELNDISDIAVVPSIGFEGLPYTIREAMRSGKPVITTKAGGCDEAVQHKINGLIIRENNSNQLSKAILTILNDVPLREKMGINSRKIFLDKFLLRDKIKEHEDLYEKLILGI